MALTLEELMSPARYVEKANIESVKGDIYLRPLSGRERERVLGAHRNEETSEEEALIDMVRLCVCDEQGALIFRDVKEIKELPSTVIDDMVQAVLNINRIGDEAVKEAEKNSETT